MKLGFIVTAQTAASNLHPSNPKPVIKISPKKSTREILLTVKPQDGVKTLDSNSFSTRGYQLLCILALEGDSRYASPACCARSRVRQIEMRERNAAAKHW
ncbi:unnamed protein product [Spodoptera exigua]|nr:unnamed protein product [Spodoptera exigua]